MQTSASLLTPILLYETGRDMIKGGWHKDPNDPGGWTQWGLAARWHPDLAPEIIAGTLPLGRAVQRYQERYVTRAEQWPVGRGVQFLLLDAYVHGSSYRMILEMQRILNDTFNAGLDEDGKFGKDTAAVIADLSNTRRAALIRALSLHVREYAADAAREMVRAGKTRHDYTEAFVHRMLFRFSRGAIFAASDES